MAFLQYPRYDVLVPIQNYLLWSMIGLSCPSVAESNISANPNLQARSNLVIPFAIFWEIAKPIRLYYWEVKAAASLEYPISSICHLFLLIPNNPLVILVSPKPCVLRLHGPQNTNMATEVSVTFHISFFLLRRSLNMSLGELTTTFIPPSSCISSFSNVYIVGSLRYVAGGPVSTDGCFPSNYNDAQNNYYSPGICPARYTSACSSINSIGALTETAVICCPTFVFKTSPIDVAKLNIFIGHTLATPILLLFSPPWVAALRLPRSQR